MDIRLAVIGLGRIGAMHARNAARLSGAGQCRLTALVDIDVERAQGLAKALEQEAGGPIAVFGSVEELIDAGAAEASFIATPTGAHHRHASLLIESGQRILLEKPMTDSLAADREFAAHLDEKAPNALMLAFQRRFDQPLRCTKRLAAEGAVGRIFKVVSILEDSRPAPKGYQSPGIFYDMAVHNVDEVLWIAEERPVAASAIGNRLFSYRHTDANEDFDDGFLYMWFPHERIAQIQVTRNHVPGYRNEMWVFGEKGFIHCGHFDGRKHMVMVEAYDDAGRTIHHEEFATRDYGRPVPEFLDRFGPAYEAELEAFLDCCRRGAPFPVTHRDGLAAMEVIDAAYRGLWSKQNAAEVRG